MDYFNVILITENSHKDFLERRWNEMTFVKPEVKEVSIPNALTVE